MSGARRGRPPTFSRDELLDTARRLGPDGIGMQRVADALGVARTSLYWHVRDQDELGELVLGAIVEEQAGDWVPGDEADWIEWLDAYARALRRTTLAAGGWLRYGNARRLYSARALGDAERVLAALVAGGLDIEEATLAFSFVSQLVLANVREATGADEPRKQQGRDAFRAELESVEAGALPHLHEATALRRRLSPERQFEFALATALDGLRSRVAAAR